MVSPGVPSSQTRKKSPAAFFRQVHPIASSGRLYRSTFNSFLASSHSEVPSRVQFGMVQFHWVQGNLAGGERRGEIFLVLGLARYLDGLPEGEFS